jgi:DNA-binding CsgD family transcriptional regulator
MRSLLPKHLQDLFKKKETSATDPSREYSFDTEFDPDVKGTRGEPALAHLHPLEKERENLYHWQSLSPREKEVVALVCMNQRNYQIAETLGIAHGTVKSHLGNIFKKFNLRDRHAIRLALRDWDFPTWWQDRHLLPTPLPSPTIYR